MEKWKYFRKSVFGGILDSTGNLLELLRTIQDSGCVVDLPYTEYFSHFVPDNLYRTFCTIVPDLFQMIAS